MRPVSGKMTRGANKDATIVSELSRNVHCRVRLAMDVTADVVCEYLCYAVTMMLSIAVAETTER